ncbi:hypothetical protein STEG23_021978, partial [Scotinomys teguina]
SLAKKNICKECAESGHTVATIQAATRPVFPIHLPATDPPVGSVLSMCGIKSEIRGVKIKSIKPLCSPQLRDGDIEVRQEHHKARNKVKVGCQLWPLDFYLFS